MADSIGRSGAERRGAERGKEERSRPSGSPPGRCPQRCVLGLHDGWPSASTSSIRAVHEIQDEESEGKEAVLAATGMRKLGAE